MPKVLYVFNTGQANFSMLCEDGEAVVLDAGASESRLRDYRRADPSLFIYHDGAGISMLRNILRSHETNRMSFVISHQDADHWNLIRDVALSLREVNKGATFGPIVVGGELEPYVHNARHDTISPVPFNETLAQMATEGILSDEGDSLIVHHLYTDAPGHFMSDEWRYHSSGAVEPFVQHELNAPVSLLNDHLKLFIPNRPNSIPNGKSLVAVYDDGQKKLLFPGDAIPEFFPTDPTDPAGPFANIGFMIHAHHGSTISGIADKWHTNVLTRRDNSIPLLSILTQSHFHENGAEGNVIPDVLLVKNSRRKKSHVFSTSVIPGTGYQIDFDGENMALSPIRQQEHTLWYNGQPTPDGINLLNNSIGHIVTKNQQSAAYKTGSILYKLLVDAQKRSRRTNLLKIARATSEWTGIKLPRNDTRRYFTLAKWFSDHQNEIKIYHDALC
jgi:hypothetical protein